MKTEPITLEHKNLLFPLMKQINSKIAEYSFANLYLFRKSHSYQICFDKELFIMGVSYDGRRYMMPTKTINNIDKTYLNELLEYVDFIFPIDETWLEYLKNDYTIDYKDGDTDYVYNIEKLRSYAGKKLHSKRNLLHQFESSYEAKALPLFGAEKVSDAKNILLFWQEKSQQNIEETDFQACMEALELYDELVLCGYIYYVNGEPAGFIIGEELNDDTFALHFAKGITKFKGIYQYMFNNFAKILPDKYKFVNFEQDLDKENLKAAKSSYNPDIMIRKYRIYKKKS